jgi:hypothetical protein
VSSIPPGAVTFEVTNAGETAHDFKLCTARVTPRRPARASASARGCCGPGSRRA